MDKMKIFRAGTKLVASDSVKVMIGGIVAAVMPPNVSIVYKAVTAIGSLIVAGFVGEKIEDYVDRKIDDCVEVVDVIKDEIQKNIDILKENMEEEVRVEA